MVGEGVVSRGVVGGGVVFGDGVVDEGRMVVFGWQRFRCLAKVK